MKFFSKNSQKEQNFQKQLNLLYNNDLKKFIFTLTRNNDIMEEILQNTVAMAWEKQWQLKSEETMKSWLFTIAKNEVNKYYRKHPMILNLEDYYDEVEELPLSDCQQKDLSDLLQAVEETASIRSAIDHLEGRYQQIILLHYYEEMSLKDISKTLSINYNTIKTIHKRALARLKEELSAENGGALR